MNTVEIGDFQARLLTEKRRIETELADKFDLQNSLTDSVKELSAYDNHPADLGSETFEREKDLALYNNAHEILNRINEALERIKQGVYGICEECGRQITMARLQAVPYTSMCIACQEAEEHQRQTRIRPIEEESLSPPFGRTFLSGTEMVGMDGADIWKEVAKYGTSDTPSDLDGLTDIGEDFYNRSDEEGIVEPVERIIDVGPDAIPPDPE